MPLTDAEMNLRVTVTGASQARSEMNATATVAQSTFEKVAAAAKSAGATSAQVADSLKGMGVSAVEADAAVTAAFGEVASGADKVTVSIGRSTGAAIAFRGAMQELGIVSPRVLGSFIGQSQLLGPILAGAFAPIAAGAALEVLGRMSEKVVEFATHTEEATDAWAAADKQLEVDEKKIETIGRERLELMREESFVGKDAAEVARLKAIYAADDIRTAQQNLEDGGRTLKIEQDKLAAMQAQRVAAEAVTSTMAAAAHISIVGVGGPKSGDIAAQEAAVAKASSAYDVLAQQEAMAGEQAKLSSMESGQAAKDASETAAKKAQEAAQKQIRALDELNAKHLEGRNFMIEQADALAKEEERLDAEKAKFATEQDEFIFKAHLSFVKDSEKLGEEEVKQTEESYKKQTAAFMKEAERRKKVAEEEAKKEEEAAHKALHAIDSEFNCSLTKWITGQERWRRLEYEVWTDIGSAAVKNLLKMGEQELILLVKHLAINKAKLADDAATATAGAAVNKAIASETILVHAKEWAAGAGSAVAGVPIIGPILAPIAAAAGFAAAMAFGSFDRGGIVPRDMIARVHEGEGVFTPEQTRNVKQIAEGGGGGGDFHFHAGSPQLLDSRGLDKVLNRNMRTFERMAMRIARNKGHINRGGIRR